MNVNRFSAFVLSVALCLSLAACSEKANSEKDMGANADGSTTTTVAADTTTTTEEKKAEPIKLTTENWQDYFEVKYEFDDIEYDENGNLECPHVYAILYIKDGYTVPEGEENKVNIDFSATGVWRFIYFNTQTLEAQIGEVVPTRESEPYTGYLDSYFKPGDTGRGGWINSSVIYSADFVTDIGDYTEDTLFHYLDGWYWNDELEAMALKIPIEQIPEDFVCKSVTGYLVPVEQYYPHAKKKRGDFQWRDESEDVKDFREA